MIPVSFLPSAAARFQDRWKSLDYRPTASYFWWDCVCVCVCNVRTEVLGQRLCLYLLSANQRRHPHLS